MPYFILWFFLTILVPSQGGAQTPLTMEEAVSQALKANPGLKAKEAEVQASKAGVGIARSLDDPMVGVEFENVPINTTDVTRGMATNYSVIQKIPFPSKLITRGKAAKRVYQAEKSNYELERLNLIVATEHAFHDLYFIEKSLKINREVQGLWQSLVASEQGRYETGKENSQNFLKARVALEKLQGESELLEAKKIEGQAKLDILRGKNPSEEIILAELSAEDHYFPSYAELEKQVLEKHPELKAAQYNVAASKANLSLAKQETVIPDLQARFSYGERYGAQDTWTAEAMITVPFLWGKNRKGIQEAKAMEKMAKREEESLHNERLAMLQETYARLQSAQKIYHLYQSKILPNATVAFKSAQAGYQTGKLDFINTIDTAREFQEAKFKTLEAFVDYHRAMTHLKLAAGEDFITPNEGKEKLK